MTKATVNTKDVIAKINSCDARISSEQYKLASYMLQLATSNEVKSFDTFIKECDDISIGLTTAKAYLLVGRLMAHSHMVSHKIEFIGGKTKDGVKYDGVKYSILSLIAKACKKSRNEFSAEKVDMLIKDIAIVQLYNEDKAKAFNKACAEDGYKIDAVEFHNRLVEFSKANPYEKCDKVAKANPLDAILADIRKAVELIENKEVEHGVIVLNDIIEKYTTK